MSNLIFSANIVMPIFFVIVLGYLLKRKGLLTDSFRSKASTLVFYYALPCSLFKSVAGSDLKSGFDLKFVLYVVGSTLAVFVLAWFITPLIIKERSQISATVHGAYRGNFAYVGLAILTNLLGTSTLPCSVLVIAFVIPIYSILAVIVLSYYDPSGKKPSVKEQLIKIIKNPLIVAIFIGIPFSLLQIKMPNMIDKTLSYLAQLATPLALLLIGANLKPETFKKKPKGIILGTLIKIVFAPTVFTLLAIVLGFRGEAIATIFVMHAVPSATNSYIMTEQMGGDAELGAGLVMATSLLTVITMTIGIFALKSFGLV